MKTAWNFERRRATCARFLVGVWVIAKGLPGAETSLEAVRSRMKLPPEDALFAARQLDADALIVFEPQGAVRSTPAGIARAGELFQTAISSASDFVAAQRIVNGAGFPRQMLEIAILANGGMLACTTPVDGGDRLALVDGEIVFERRGADGKFVRVERA